MKYTVYTDGSSRGNPGNAGWGVVFMDEIKVREYNGYFERATNNQMEIYAVLFALNISMNNLVAQDDLEIWSDSEYVVKSINLWLKNWRKGGWKNSQKKEVMNKDLWEKVAFALDSLEYKGIKISMRHLLGHKGHIYNERADKLCTSAALQEDLKLYFGSVLEYEDFLRN